MIEITNAIHLNEIKQLQAKHFREDEYIVYQHSVPYNILDRNVSHDVVYAKHTLVITTTNYGSVFGTDQSHPYLYPIGWIYILSDKYIGFEKLSDKVIFNVINIFEFIKLTKHSIHYGVGAKTNELNIQLIKDIYENIEKIKTNEKY